MKNSIDWFEIPVKDLDRAVKFYRQVLGYDFQIMKINKVEMAVIKNADKSSYGATGALVEGEGYIPSMKGINLYLLCDSIEDCLKETELSGGKVLTKKYSIGSHGDIAHIVDSEGNRLTLHTLNKEQSKS
ncbi:MAG: VOC family protein [Proteobacteria bacterium]|nr:VOC family protein [Pseudomonadota bacterium]